MLFRSCYAPAFEYLTARFWHSSRSSALTLIFRRFASLNRIWNVASWIINDVDGGSLVFFSIILVSSFWFIRWWSKCGFHPSASILLWERLPSRGIHERGKRCVVLGCGNGWWFRLSIVEVCLQRQSISVWPPMVGVNKKTPCSLTAQSALRDYVDKVLWYMGILTYF